MRYALLTLILLFSCSKKLDTQNSESFSEIKDVQLLNGIRRYISETKPISSESILCVEIATIGWREIIYINSEDDLAVVRFSGNPQHISIVDGYVVFIYTNATEYIDEAYSIDATIERIKNVGVNLKDRSRGGFYDPISWRLDRCGQGDSLKRVGVSGIDFLPCGYYKNPAKDEIYSPTGDTIQLVMY